MADQRLVGNDASSAAQEAEQRSVAARPDDEIINDDERERFFWESRYPPVAVARIRLDAAYVVCVFLLSLGGLLITWRGDLFDLVGCQSCSRVTLGRYSYLFFAGLLGGSLFGLKYLYKVVARGWWNLDRELWRFFSPWLAGGMALGVGALANAGLFGFTVNDSPSGASFVSLGFIAGYFADSASRKMQEIADTLFGTRLH
ncbi:hypothetical protein [Luteimonas notoginsengisoli]|uniref:Transmembrane protein n=1 Tax=Luteimonas notoginsengisoli TaxID=1578200 RepID=A0ABV7UVP6_9GAMM